MKRALNVAALSSNVAPVSGSLIAVLLAHNSPATFSLLTPVRIMAATSRQIVQLTQNRKKQYRPGMNRPVRDRQVEEIIIPYKIDWNMKTCVQPDSKAGSG